MNKSIAMLYLNAASIKEYLSKKNLALLLGFFILFTFLTDAPASGVGIFMIYGVLYAGYPFAAAEKIPLDLLYASLPLRQKSLVAGHYLFALLINLVTGVSSFFLCGIVGMLRGKPVDAFELLLTVSVCFFLCVFLELFQYPFFFKVGYHRARPMLLLPIFLLFAAASLLGAFLRASEFSLRWEPALQWAGGNLPALIFLLVLFVLICCFLSFLLSLRFYSQREF